MYRIIPIARGFIVMPEVDAGRLIPWSEAFYAEDVHHIAEAIAQLEAVRALQNDKLPAKVHYDHAVDAAKYAGAVFKVGDTNIA